MYDLNLINSPINNLNIFIGDCQEKDETKSLMPFMEEAQNINRNIKKCFCNFLENEDNIGKLQRVKDCSNIITFKHYEKLGLKKLDSINLCRERLCLNCCVALARKNCLTLERVLKKHKGQLYFITLTVRNIKGENLRRTISNMNKAFTGFARAEGVDSFYKSVEITYNKKNNTYHPHIHFISKKQFKNSYLNYTWAKWYNKKQGTNEKWLSCKCEKIDNIFSACCELNKYITKPLNITDKTIDIFYKQLKGLRLHSSAGEFKKQVAEEKSLMEQENINKESFLSDYDYKILRYIYNGNNYIVEN